MPNSGRKLVALALADMANDEGICWPSLGNLSSRCNIRTEAVRDHLKHLCVIGLISRTDRFKDNRQTSSLFTFMPLQELRGRVAKIARGEGGDFHQGGGGRKSLPRESSVRNRHIEPSTKGAVPALGLSFSDKNRRPYPTSEDQMYELLEASDIETNPDKDGDFYNRMVKAKWRIRGKLITDWMLVYEGIREHTTNKDNYHK